MKYQVKPSALLVLEDGTVFHGKAAGIIGTTTGEIAFNTGMTGYQEIFTDPSYLGQIVVMASPHIGNYGVHKDEVESDSVKISGLVCKKFSVNFSRPSGESSLQTYFERDNIVGICEVDTRALVRHIRNAGAMNAIISSEILDPEILKQKLKTVPSMDGLELSSRVSTKEAFTSGDAASPFKVALLDLGVKKNIVRCLVERGCYVKVFPMQASLDEMLAFEPNGFMLSNGPGDPGVMSDTIEKVKAIVATGLPIFGICLGHQILALSQGLPTKKMHNGHRGINHPIKNLITGKSEITSQNHGFVVDKEALSNRSDIEMTHVHLNDGTLAGIRLKGKPVFSVQYHPEANPGPYDARYLFDDFVHNMKVHSKIKVNN
ncbi:MAG TPA: glutamine-hydrolyzing carbamoyl-phosphate synthase small subunit [Flavobacteriales bacterium]|nr:glutamine-hydrolyzing carbamoyl-phosphate synthase small subunit [Flavobacteriales bacterium]HRE97070.1 glutamine-hydrolyzing carbamoyl-phosphate synthase small subunit [Flavobacteriales bacterium]HRJ35432.1 glutamine-hydrolyzing carbamoyl-phosphate synthase small subunit [Flavobacteriales bacterium]HRJ39392.1 glutamine-hydrolyzing carbamoyl-phosphate synthase small subunit [Flavobacteriales bacterium]